MAKYFDKILSIFYDINNKQFTTYQVATNVFFRVAVIRNVLENISFYYDYLIKDEDTPEILAEKVYGDPEAHWLIMMTNQIVDAQYDWPLSDTEFGKYIISKYGSISNAKTSIHHYEKVVMREDEPSGILTETRFIINHEKFTINNMTVPYDTYNTLAETQEVNTYNVNNKTVTEVIKRDAISCYDYEYDINERKRTIKIIKPEYYSQIIREFDALAKVNQRLPYIRRLI